MKPANPSTCELYTAGDPPKYLPRHARLAHTAALSTPTLAERPHVELYNAVKSAVLADWHEDGFACDYLVELVQAARNLLNMEAGRLDCGTLDHFYARVLRACGVGDV